MRAAVLRSPGSAARRPLEIEELPVPVPAADELLVRVSACAVCRTDLQLATGEIPGHVAAVVPGHQVVGRVEAVGARVSAWSIGDRLGVTWLGGFDGTCRFCRSGRQNLCPAATFTGWDRDGGFAELCVVRSDVAVPLPSGFTDLAASPLLCGGVIGYRALRLSGIERGGRLGLYGFGASALLAIQVARYWGCEVHVASRSRDDLERATALGASSVGGYDDPPPHPLDAAITFAPAGSVVVSALRAVDRGGTVVVNAIHLDAIPSFSYDDLWLERSIRSVANVTPRDAREFVALAAEIPVTTRVERHPLEEANLALERLASGAIEGAAVLVP